MLHMRKFINGRSLLWLLPAASLLMGASAHASDAVNTGKVTVPSGVTDPTPGNNSATDTDAITRSSDLVVTKDDSTTTVNADGTTTYIVRVTNNGPSTVVGASLTDPAATGLSKTAVACSAAATNACTTAPTIAEVEGATFTLPTLASGAFYEISINAHVTALGGTVTNVATANVPSGYTDPNTTNNSGTDTNTVQPVADLVMAKSNGVTGLTANQATTYTLTVTNNGPSPATGAVVTDVIGSNLTCPSTGTVTIAGDGVPTGTFTVADLTGAGITLGTLNATQSTTLTVNCTVAANPTP